MNLFGGRSQLIIHHFMFGPDWDAGCPSCSLEADHAEGAIVHLEHHDVAYVRVSRAPLAKIEAYRKRMDWKAKWVSSYDSDFNYDFHVSFKEDDLRKGRIYYNFTTIEDEKYQFEELPGLSVFYQDENGDVFHTYSSYARGNEEVIGAFIYLDITPKGRNEQEIMGAPPRRVRGPARGNAAARPEGAEDRVRLLDSCPLSIVHSVRKVGRTVAGRWRYWSTSGHSMSGLPGWRPHGPGLHAWCHGSRR